MSEQGQGEILEGSFKTLVDPADFFIADSEVVDSLRLESSRATPEQQKTLHDAAVEVKDSVIKNYEPYILPEVLDRTAHVEDRLVLMSKDQFQKFYGQWDGTGDRPPNAVLAATFRQGEIIALNEPEAAWDTFDVEGQESAIRQFGSEAEARRIVGDIATYDNLAHEVIHQFQDNELPDLFLEIATRYYQRQTTNELRFGHIFSPTASDSIATYEQLIGKYGDAVHDVYFGKPLEAALRDEIVSALSSIAKGHPSLSHLG